MKGPVGLFKESIKRKFIFRSEDGLWTLIPRTYAPKTTLERLTITIRVYPPADPEQVRALNKLSGGNVPPPPPPRPSNESDASLTYQGKLNRHTDDLDAVLACGQFMRLLDGQALVMSRGRAIFEYSVDIQIQE